MKLFIFSLSIVACNSFVAPRLPTTQTSTSQKKSFFDNVFTTTSTSSSDNVVSPKSKALIEKTKDLIYNKSGFYTPYDSDEFSEDFVFRGPFIGPLNKKDYLQTMDSFSVYESIPDISPNAWGFSVDPKDDNRVWFMVRNTGTFTGSAFLPDSLNYKANGASLDGCPETFSVTFDENQKLKYLSVGYVADRFEGNTNGQGAAVGIFNAIGLPFPKVGPFQRFTQWLLTEIISTKNRPLSYSVKDIPEWWTDKNIGSQGYL